METLKKEVGRRIRRIREARERAGGDDSKVRRKTSMTIEELGERAGLTPEYIGKLENGTQNPTLETLGRIAEALDTQLVDLLRDADADDNDKERALADLRAFAAGFEAEDITYLLEVARVMMKGRGEGDP